MFIESNKNLYWMDDINQAYTTDIIRKLRHEMNIINVESNLWKEYRVYHTTCIDA